MENVEAQEEKVGPITYKFTLKNIEKILEQKASSINNSVTSKLDGFIAEANKNIQTMDKKFSQMYGVLVRQFLTNLENRIYTNELGHKAFVQVITERLYEIQSKLNPENILPKDDFMKELELNYIQKMTEIHNESEKVAAEENKQVEELNVKDSKEDMGTAVQTEEQSTEAQ